MIRVEEYRTAETSMAGVLVVKFGKPSVWHVTTWRDKNAPVDLMKGYKPNKNPGKRG